MRKVAIEPDASCLSAAIRACGAAREWRRVVTLSDDLSALDLLPPDSQTASLLVEAHARRSHLKAASEWFATSQELGFCLDSPALEQLLLMMGAREEPH